MNSTVSLQTALTLIVNHPHLIDKLETLPNSPHPINVNNSTWVDVEVYQNWRIQKNSIFGSYRLLNPANQRRGWWFDEAQLRTAFQKVISLMD